METWCIISITAQQLNRTGASVIDAALQANKEDVTRLVGRDSIAGAWEIIIKHLKKFKVSIFSNEYFKTSLIAGTSC